MIQELFGGGNTPTTTSPLVKDTNIISIPFPPLKNTQIQNSSPTTPPPSTTTLTNPSNLSSVSNTNTTTTNNNSGNSEANNQKLRCPRCDSTNTKFCYYNNYNLTQPRHFCKTCRRYWTKGGTLRNVPIGGGCRKNKTVASSSSSSTAASGFSKSSFNSLVRSAVNNKPPPLLPSELLFNGNPGFLGNGFSDAQSELQSNPFFPSFTQPQHENSHMLALFRSHNPNPFSSVVKTETSSTTTLGIDPFANGASPLVGSSSFQRSSNHNQMLNGFGLVGPDFKSGGSNIMELYQRLKSSTSDYGYCGNENPAGTVTLGNLMGSSSSSPSPSPSSLSSSSGMYMREAHAGVNVGGYGMMNMMSNSTIPGWNNEFSTVPINGSFP